MTQEIERKLSHGQGKAARVAFNRKVDMHPPPANANVTESPPTTHHQRSQTHTAVQPDAQSLRPPNSSADDARNPENTVPPTGGPSETGRNAPRPTAQLIRAKSDYFPHNNAEAGASKSDDEDPQLRHGWQEEYTSSEYLKVLNSVSRPICFRENKEVALVLWRWTNSP